ncbi:putative conserved membrane protein [Synechococcus sp. RS9915]|nr:putative conserved membrane protein [Synechococcus sp. RS9915]QNJ13486.1 putative conserved membrane protein [Synechococcus sp. A18-46.1]
MIGLSWWWPGRLWISIPIGLAVSAWWLLFLVIVPAAYRSGDLQP